MNLRIIKKYIIIFASCLIFTSANSDIDIPESIYSKIATQLLKASEKPNLTRNEILSSIDKNNSNQLDKEKLKQILNQKIRKHKNRKIVLDLFDQSKAGQADNSSNIQNNICITSPTFWQNMELFCGQNTLDMHLLSIINRTNSEAGTIMLAKTLAEPTTDIQELKRRQNIVKELVTNEETFNQLNILLLEYAKIEEDLLSFWDEKIFNNLFGSDFYYPPDVLSFLPDEVLDTFFPKTLRQYLNQSPIALHFNAISNNFGSIKLTYHELQEIGFERLISFIKNNTFADSSEQQKRFGDRWNSMYYNAESLKINWKQLKNSKNPIDALLNTLNTFISFDSIGFNIYHIFSSVNSILKTLKNEKRNIKLLQLAYSKLKNASTIIKSIPELNNIIEKNSELSKNINCLEKIKYLLDQTSSESQNFDTLIEFLKKDDFAHEPTILRCLFNRGKILAASYLIARTQNKLVDIMQSIGEIDLYLSVAKLYKESQDKNANYCFANYIDQENPYINLVDLWTPFINQERVITNNIELGKSEFARNAIISGPNAGGKSTILKSIMVNILFAQTLGIASSKEIYLTPFTYIDTYLNIVDDIAAGNSLFKSEVLRVKELLETLKTLNPQKCCVIMDEMFNGTNPLEGEAAGYAVGKYMSLLPNTITLLASHYAKMTNLEKDTNGLFKNFKVSVIKNKDKNLSYPFKLEIGKTDQTIAIDILENEKFDPKIINDARSIIGEVAT